MQTMEVEPESLRCSLARLEKHVRPGALGCREGPRGERSRPLHGLAAGQRLENLTTYKTRVRAGDRARQREKQL